MLKNLCGLSKTLLCNPQCDNWFNQRLSMDDKPLGEGLTGVMGWIVSSKKRYVEVLIPRALEWDLT